MELLPTEIAIEIFHHLCFHCQNPGIFPHTNTDEVRDNKKSLARLCRASKAICAVAQPILYHYYASGNLPIESKLYKDEDEFKVIKEHDYLPQFLRTLSRRPDLASQVAAMQLTERDEEECEELYHLERRQRAAAEEILRTSLRELLNGPYRPSYLGVPEVQDSAGNGDVSRWPGYPYSKNGNWLVTLALVLTPRLKSLLLATDHCAKFGFLEASPHFKLPHLRTLGLMGYRFDYHIAELNALFAAASNLEAIYACEAAGGRW